MKHEYKTPICKTVAVMQGGRLCAVSDNFNSRGQVNLNGMSGGWDAED
jgi:hypothetical protein